MARGTLIFTVMVLVIIAIALVTVVFALEIPSEIQSPHNRISEGQIHLYPNKIVIDISQASWASYADTNSMDPVLDFGANGLEIIPKNENELYIRDIAAYKPKSTQELIVHRIIDIREDSKGKYFIFKGDNNKTPDPEKVRFSQIKYVLIGVIY